MSRLFSAKLPIILLIGLGLILPVLTVFAVANGADNPALRLLHDPFQKPQKLLPAPQNTTTGGDHEESAFPATSRLTAILRAGRNSMVIVDGKTLVLGESINGYQLTAVTEHSAVFTKNGKQHVMEMDKINEIK